MAQRVYFKSTPEDNRIFQELSCEFKFFRGFSIKQKQLSIKSFHEQILANEENARILEVSTKSNNPLGVELSAFNLKFWDKTLKREFPIENVFQASKVFAQGGPYKDLLYVHPRDAKRDERLKNSGELISFRLHDHTWKLEPKTVFYDWLYINALYSKNTLSKEIMDYNIFTDIEYNHKKSINCQARSAAIYVSLKLLNKLKDVICDSGKLYQWYDKSQFSQLTLL